MVHEHVGITTSCLILRCESQSRRDMICGTTMHPYKQWSLVPAGALNAGFLGATSVACAEPD
jgi:hypothetical protein